MKKCLIILLFLLFPLTSFAANYCARPAAQGSGTGVDWTNAVALSTVAGSSSYRGHTVYFSGESYGSVTFSAAVSGSSYITLKKATATDYGAAGGWNPSWGNTQATFSYLNISTDYWIVDGNSTTSYGIALNFGGSTTQATNISSSHIQLKSIRYDGQVPNHSRGIRLYNGGTDVLIQNIELDQCGNDAILVHTYDNVTIDNIWIHDRDTDDDTHGDAFELYGKSGASYTIKNSRIDWQGQQIFFSGVVSQHGTWYIYGNRFYNTEGAPAVSCKGIHPHSTDPTVAVYVYNNTFENLYYAHDLSSNSSGDVRNNIYYNLAVSVGGFGSTTHDYNYFQTSLGGSGESNAQLGGDPFVSIGTNNYHLAGATNAGDTSIGSPYNTDPDGVTRGSDGTWDRGAFEYESGSRYVTQSGAGAHDGSSLSNAWSAAEFNALSGDYSDITFYFSGTFTTKISSGIYGTSGHQVTLDGYVAGDCSPLSAECTSSAIFTAETDAFHINYGYDYITLQDMRFTGRLRIQYYGGNNASSYIQIKRCHVYETNQNMFLLEGPGTSYRGTYNLVENSKFDTCGMSLSTDKCVNFVSQTNLIVRNNVFTNDWTKSTSASSANMIEVHDTYNALFEYNKISKAPNQAGIAVKENYVNEDIIIRFNDIFDNPRSGIFLGYVDGIYLYGNRIWQNGKNFESVSDPRCGIDIADGATDVHFWANVVYDNERRGIWIWSRNSLPPGTVSIINNTIQHNGFDNASSSDYDTGLSYTDGTGTMTGLTVRNNIFADNRGGDYSSYWQMYIHDSITTKVLQNNTLYYSGQTATWHWLGTERTLSAMQALGYEDDPPVGSTADPGFNDSANDDFTLNGISVNNGANLSDCFNVTVQGTPHSLCYEDALNPETTDWTTTPPTVNTTKQGLQGSAWERGAYVFIGEQAPESISGLELN